MFHVSAFAAMAILLGQGAMIGPVILKEVPGLAAPNARLNGEAEVVARSAGSPEGFTPRNTSKGGSAAGTVLAIDGTQFTLNGKPTFLLGISYYGALGAPEEFIRRDLDDIQKHGFNWLRVWATWNAYGTNVSAVDERGEARRPFLSKLKSLVAECDRRGLIVDITLTRGEPLPSFDAHQRAVETLVAALKTHRNWYIDLANEHDVEDARHATDAELKSLRDQVKRLDPDRLVTASFGGHELSESDLRTVLLTVGVDFVAPHLPRDTDSPAKTEARTRRTLALMKGIGRVVPVHYQEPFRRGYTRWQPVAEDFLNDLRGAIAGGAAGWCFHNGGQRGTKDEQPRRSFDMRGKRLFDQLDAEEQKIVEKAASVLPARP